MVVNGGDELVPGRDIGVAFSLVCDRGFAVGLCSHRHARMGTLVWMAEPFFDGFPTADDVEAIETWRWPVFFPLGAAFRRKIVDRIGRVPIPQALRSFPTLRTGGQLGRPWTEQLGGVLGADGPTTENRDLPVNMIVNDTALKEMLVTGWRPADRW